MIRMKLLPLCLLYMCINVVKCDAQAVPLNKYGLPVVENIRQYRKTIDTIQAKHMVDLRQWIPGIVLDLRYSSSHNFMQRPLYPYVQTTYLRRKAAQALAYAQGELNKAGLGLKIWDAYRPYSVTEKMWEPVKDDRYAADPRKGSGHNRGVAVDLTLILLKTGEELDMGTGFDNFSDTAHPGFKELPAQVLKNRQLLQRVMEAAGFKVLDTEWWHFYLPDAPAFELLNLSFKELDRINAHRRDKRK